MCRWHISENPYVREPLSDVRLYLEVAEFPDFRLKFGASRNGVRHHRVSRKPLNIFYVNKTLVMSSIDYEDADNVHSLNLVHSGVPAQYPTFSRVDRVSRFSRFSFPIFNENREIQSFLGSAIFRKRLVIFL